MRGDVFVSYSRRDKEFVYKLVNDLEDREAFAWIDRGNIGGGQPWREAIDAGIRDCKAFILVMSPDSIASSNVGEELELAFGYGKPIIPLLYRRVDVAPPLNERLRRYQYLDFRRGGYESNLLDLIASLAGLGVKLDVDQAKLERRRDELLGAVSVDVEWTAVFGRIPKWALAWAVGWLIFLTIVTLAGIVWTSTSEPTRLALLAPGGLVGGFVGGLAAGFFTMVALRHNATSIRWKHMSPTIRIWSIVGPIGVVIAVAIAFAGFGAGEPAECTGDFNECFGQAFAPLFDAIVRGILAIFYAFIAVFAIGGVAGWLTVRHIRRLEPGIGRRQAAGVVAGWGCGSIIAAIASLIAWVAIGTFFFPSGS